MDYSWACIDVLCPSRKAHPSHTCTYRPKRTLHPLGLSWPRDSFNFPKTLIKYGWSGSLTPSLKHSKYKVTYPLGGWLGVLLLPWIFSSISSEILYSILSLSKSSWVASQSTRSIGYNSASVLWLILFSLAETPLKNSHRHSHHHQ